MTEQKPQKPLNPLLSFIGFLLGLCGIGFALAGVINIVDVFDSKEGVRRGLVGGACFVIALVAFVAMKKISKIGPVTAPIPPSEPQKQAEESKAKDEKEAARGFIGLALLYVGYQLYSLFNYGDIDLSLERLPHKTPLPRREPRVLKMEVPDGARESLIAAIKRSELKDSDKAQLEATLQRKMELSSSQVSLIMSRPELANAFAEYRSPLLRLLKSPR